MTARRVGSAVVIDPEMSGVGIMTSATSSTPSGGASTPMWSGPQPPHLGRRVRRPGVDLDDGGAAMMRGGFGTWS